MASDAKKQSALSYEQFVTEYTFHRDSRHTVVTEQLEKRYPKFAAKLRLLEKPGALREGSTVYVIIRKHSRTGYSKSISLYTFAVRTDAAYGASSDNPQLQPLTLTYNVGRLMGYNTHNYEGSDVIRTDDYPQEFVAHLSQALFGIDKASALRCEVL